MKIAIFSPFGLPELGACSLRVESFREYFSANGCEVTVFSPVRPTAKSEELPKSYKRYSGLMEAISVVRRGKFDAIVGTSPPITHPFFVMLAAKVSGARFILDVRDPWTYAYERLGIYKPWNPKLWIYKAFEVVAYNFSDAVFAVTGKTGEIIGKATIDKKKILVIENGTDTRLFAMDKSKGTAMRKKLGIPKDAFVALYGGSFSGKELDVLVKEVAPEVKSTKSFLLFVLPKEPGNGPELKDIEMASITSGIKDQCRFVEYAQEMGFASLKDYYSAADLGLDPLPNAMEYYCVPVKTYDYFACGLPVIAKGDRRGALNEVIEGSKLGWFEQDWKGFRSAFKEACSNRLKVQEMGRQAMRAAASKFERKIQNEKAMKYIKMISKK